LYLILISAHAFLKKSIKFITCGSVAAFLIIVLPSLKTLATIKFSVELTQKLALSIFSPVFNFHPKIISSSSNVELYQIASNQFKCASIGLAQILHQPGKGILILPKKCNKGDNKKIEDLIFLIFSKFKFSFVILLESKCKVFHSHSYFTQIPSNISRNVITSQIFGTLFNVTLPFNNKAAHKIGKAAFFDPLTLIVQLNSFCHLTTNII
jgi:hypothetical protein